MHVYKFGPIFLLIIFLLACTPEASPPLPTRIPTEQAALASPSPSPSPSPTQTPPPLATLAPSWTPSPTASPTATRTYTPSHTPTITFTPPPLFFPTATPSPTITFTPSITPTRVLNPDAVVAGSGAPLRAEPSDSAPQVTVLAVGTALKIIARNQGGSWLRVELIGGAGGGWVKATEVVVFIDLGDIEVISQGGPALQHQALGPPPTVGAEMVGEGQPFKPYRHGTCGDTYWLGDGLERSMQETEFQGRYPRFAAEPIRVYVHGLRELPPEEQAAWELAISQAFAELSQAVRLERVPGSGLDFFQPWVPLETILTDAQVEMVWHIAPPELFQSAAPCNDPLSCSQYAFRGAVMGGPLSFAGALYLPNDSPDKKTSLLHAALPALGLWVNSGQAGDIMALASTADGLSERDVRSLRCLYTAPPYGDAVVE